MLLASKVNNERGANKSTWQFVISMGTNRNGNNTKYGSTQRYPDALYKIACLSHGMGDGSWDIVETRYDDNGKYTKRVGPQSLQYYLGC